MTHQTSSSSKTNLRAALCYALGWISGIFFLLAEKNNRCVRFHAWQSTIFFGFLTVLGTVAFFATSISFLEVAIAVAAVVIGRILIYLAYAGQLYSLPLIGQMAERLARLKGIASQREPTSSPGNVISDRTA